MVEKEELMKAVEVSSDSCNEKEEQEIKVTRIVLDIHVVASTGPQYTKQSCRLC